MGGFTTVEGFIGQVVLHGVDEDCIHGLALLLLVLIPGHRVPVAYQARGIYRFPWDPVP